MSFLDKLNERYATKAMNGKVVPQEKIDNILEAVRLAPTSSGLQPFEVFVVTKDETKSSIREIAWNQSPVTDCSHLLVFAAWDNYTVDRINHMFDLTNEMTSVSMTINGPAPMMLAFFMNAAIDQECEKYILQHKLENEIETKIAAIYKQKGVERPKYQGELPEGNQVKN